MTISREQAISELLHPGRLTVGINLGNILLVTGTAANGDPEGVAPGMGKALAEKLGVELVLRSYASPGEVADAASRGEWDVGLIAIEAERAQVIDFCDAYVEIEATYLVPAGSPLQTIEDVDAPGVRIAVSDRSAYDLFLSRHLRHAELRRGPGLAGAFELFVAEKLDALAGLVPALKKNAEDFPGSRVLDGRYTSVCQAFGTRPGHPALHAFTQAFLAEARSGGLVAELIGRHGVTGKLQVAGDA